jgi:type VII secretion protein EccB
MASKKELAQAQSWSRRRLTTAFVSGIPGGKELEPGKPMRAVVSGLSLSVLLILGSLAFGLIKPALPEGWEDNSLVIAEGSGARYVSVKGTLHPVINTTSARLIIAEDAFKIVTIDDDKLADVPRGGTIGILGAPDTLPVADSLAHTSWTACLTDAADTESVAGISTVLDPNTAYAAATERATIVTVDDSPYLVAGNYYYAIEPSERSAILRAVGLEATRPTAVTAQWLGLLSTGDPLTSLAVDGAGGALPTPVVVGGVSQTAGTIIHVRGAAVDDRYVLTADGALADLSAFAYPLYLLGSENEVDLVEVSASEIAELARSENDLVPQTWPTDSLTALASQETPCALLTAVPSATAVATLAVPTAPDVDTTYPFRSDSGALMPGVYVANARSGALIYSMAAGDGPVALGADLDYSLDHGNAFLIDHTGTLFPVPDLESGVLGRLGYSTYDVLRVPQSWTALFSVGPSLTSAAAQESPTGSTSAS